VNVFLVPKLEVGHGVVADLSDEGVVVYGTLTEKLFGQTVEELVQIQNDKTQSSGWLHEFFNLESGRWTCVRWVGWGVGVF
jgi:hypothetical protein